MGVFSSPDSSSGGASFYCNLRPSSTHSRNGHGCNSRVDAGSVEGSSSPSPYSLCCSGACSSCGRARRGGRPGRRGTGSRRRSASRPSPCDVRRARRPGDRDGRRRACRRGRRVAARDRERRLPEHLPAARHAGGVGREALGVGDTDEEQQRQESHGWPYMKGGGGHSGMTSRLVNVTLRESFTLSPRVYVSVVSWFMKKTQ